MSTGSQSYWPSDQQLHPTVGPDMSRAESVTACSEETAQAVLEAIDAPRKVPDPGGDADVVLGDDGTRRSLPKLKIPGFGDTYGHDHEGGACGAPMPVSCAGCGNTFEIGRTCRRSTCPRCGAAWTRDIAANLCAKLGAVRATRDENRDDHQRYHHWVAVPPEDWRLEAQDVLDRTKKVVRDMMFAFDHEGAVIPHPWSVETPEDEDAQGKWKDILFQDLDWDEVKKQLEFRPHFHVISVGHEIPGQDLTKMLYEETGWIVKRITKSEENPVSIYNDDELARTVTYCLSHSAIDTEAASDGSAQTTYSRYGPLMTDGSVQANKRNRDKHDRLCRMAANVTLDIPMSEQFCSAETYGDLDTDAANSIRSMAAAKAAASTPPEPAGSVDDNLPDAPSSEMVVDGADGPTPTECEGRLLHLADARRLLEDEEWVEQAEHVDDLRETLDEWSDRMDELIRCGPFNSG